MSDNVRWTTVGLSSLVLGLALSWIPYILYVGNILIITGVVFVFIGRKHFGYDHEWYVDIGIAVWIISLIGTVTLNLYYASGISQRLYSQAEIYGIFVNYLLGMVIAGLFSGMSYILLVYCLSDNWGRRILYLAFTLQISVSIVIYFAIVSVVHHSPTLSLHPAIVAVARYSLLYALPTVTFSLAYYMAKRNVDTGLV